MKVENKSIVTLDKQEVKNIIAEHLERKGYNPIEISFEFDLVHTDFMRAHKEFSSVIVTCRGKDV